MSAGLPYGLQAMLKVRRLLLFYSSCHIFFSSLSLSLSLSLNARRRRVVFISSSSSFSCVRVLVQSQRRLDDDVDEMMSFARFSITY